MDCDLETPLPNRLSTRMLLWWADHRSAQAFVFITLTALAIIGHVKPELVRDLFISNTHDASDNDLLPSLGTGATSSTPPPPDVIPFVVADGECIVVVTCKDLFTKANLQAIRQSVAQLQAAPQVYKILWIDSIPALNLFGLPEPLLPDSRATERQIAAAKERVIGNPLAVGQLISGDATTLLLHVRIDWFYATTDAAVTDELRDIASAAAATVPGSDLQFRVTGRAPLYLMIASNHVKNAWKYQLIGYAIMMITALVLFRGFSAVAIVAIAPAVGVFWTMGTLPFFDLQNNPFNDIIVPVLISLVGLTDAVHLMVEVRTQRATGLDTNESTRRAVAIVGLACALTSITTAIGFASLWWAHHQIVREFGSSCVVGVVMTFISVLTIVPLGCRSPIGRRLHVGIGKSLIDAQLQRIGPLIGWILKHDRLIAPAAIIATGALAAVCMLLKPDEKRYSGLSDTGEAAIALRHLDQSLGGLEFAQVDVTWNADVDDSEKIAVLQEVDAALSAETMIGHPLGLHDLIDVLPGDGDASERFALLDLLPPSLKRAFYTPEYRRARVQFRIQDAGIAAYAPVFERVQERLRRIEQHHPQFALSLAGDAIWRWENVYRIVIDLATSLGTASVIIWIVLMIAYRSVRLGLISIVPNVFPLVMTGAILYFAGQYLEIVTVCVFTICVGIAVDDTIHFLTRYVEESRRHENHSDAISAAFTGVGSALLMTTIVLVTGLMTAVMGDARDARLFGIMGAITLTSALAADIFLLPALLSRFGSKPKSNTPKQTD